MNRALVLAEVAGVLKNPMRLGLVMSTAARDQWQLATARPHLYSYSTSRRDSADSLHLIMRWLQRAQRSDGGVAAFYSLLSGYSASYPETTGYLIPTMYDYAELTRDDGFASAAARMTTYLLSLQLPMGAFPGGLGQDAPEPSVFNTGQILSGLVRAHTETGRADVLAAAIKAGDWLVRVQSADGRWEGPTYQGRSHTYYTMVAWALAQLWHQRREPHYRTAAIANLEWALRHQRPDAWFDGINLKGHDDYLHFVAYILQGLVEAGFLLGHQAAVEGARRAAWRLLRRFEVRKWIPGAFAADWAVGRKFACITGNAQLSCVWLRLCEITGDLRYLNASLKMNDFVKERLVRRGPGGIAGGIAGSYPIWARYHSLHYINWGAKFAADALMMERRALRRLEADADRTDRSQPAE